MKLIAEKYKKLKPEIGHLTDEVIVAQAWKKTHKYMRTHNWYADTLALDISALGLEGNAASWAKGIEKNDFQLYPMELIPAAKSEVWTLDSEKGWVPFKSEERDKKPPVRPLAHLTIRDQTLASAVMLCLADAVESAQGDCGETRFSVAQNRQVYSYGNRLVCDWNSKRDGWFRWGNSETYRKFFTDYQNFLKRPIEIGRVVAQSHSDLDHVYVINLDLEKFYDHIDRTILLGRLKKISQEFGHEPVCPDFWRAVENLTDWKWNPDAEAQAKKLGIQLGKGLPQGLVASGFFANAFMAYFDRAIGKHIGNRIPSTTGIVLHDYCRYVDDLRLVVSIEDPDIEFAETKVSSWVGDQLRIHAAPALKLNRSKIKITALSDLDNQGSLSGRISLLQQELSGPADRDVLENASAVLEGLLTTQPEEIPEPLNFKHDRALVRLAKFDQDIRPDTLKRFAANRLESIMRNKRKLSAVDDQRTAGVDDLTDNESELLAKKLVRAWMQDPSLGLVLRKALEIFPSPIIAEPVFDAVFRRSSLGDSTNNICTMAMMDYLLADLFRCCVDFNGFFQRIEYPKAASPDGLFDIASGYAQKVVSDRNAAKFLTRQALLLLATLQKPVFLERPEESIQHALHAILVNRLPVYSRQRLALFEVAAQITGRYDSYVLLMLQYLKPLNQDDKYQALEELAKRGGLFWLSVWKRLQKSDESKELIARLKWAAPTLVGDPKSSKQRLSKVIASPKNGFEHEAALIKLALGLLAFAEEHRDILPLSPNEIDVKPEPGTDWAEIWRPEVIKVVCSSSAQQGPTQDPRFLIPKWVSESAPDNAVMYWIGSILRAAAVGGNDFTGNRWKPGSVQSYKGLRTGWYKRRMGMMHSAEALVGEYATISNWFTELLMTCLQWPGFEATYIQEEEIAGIQDLQSLKSVLSSRLLQLDALCCRASGMPTLITTIRRPTPRKSGGFRIVTVQQILPRSRDFSKADPTLSNAKARSDHRDHLTRISLITYRTLVAKLKADNDDSKVGADLIVFPEVAVHPDDQDILKRLADKTKAIVFAGLVFLDHDGKLVNIARWFIPDYRQSGRRWTIRDQGKAHMTTGELGLGIAGHRPCQHIIELIGDSEGPFKLSGAICYDATDLKLATDLKGKTDLFIVSAHNKDVATFDTMASALNYHMYQHVALVNKGEFGGSTIQAPYREHFDRLISHAHGSDQISINVADLDLAAFRRKHKTYKPVKKKPAGM